MTASNETDAGTESDIHLHYIDANSDTECHCIINGISQSGTKSCAPMTRGFSSTKEWFWVENWSNDGLMVESVDCVASDGSHCLTASVFDEGHSSGGMLENVKIWYWGGIQRWLG